MLDFLHCLIYLTFRGFLPVQLQTSRCKSGALASLAYYPLILQIIQFPLYHSRDGFPPSPPLLEMLSIKQMGNSPHNIVV
jgi:hypothetical protein